MSGFNNLLFALIVIVFITAAVATFYLVIKNIGTNDNREDVKNSIQTIITTNSALVIFLGFLSYMYIRNNISSSTNYIMVMLHINFLLSITAVSIAALVQLSAV